MESFRRYQAAVATRSLILTVAGMAALAWSRQWIPAAALLAGCLIGLASLFHIASSFNRLTKAGRGYVPFLMLEGVLRVLLAGAAPFFIVGRGPWLGYMTYIAGFVASLAVAIYVFKQQIANDRAMTRA